MRRQQGIKITKGIHDTILSIEFLNQFRLSERYFTRLQSSLRPCTQAKFYRQVKNRLGDNFFWA